MPRAALNSLPRPARSALNQEVRQGSCEWLCHSWDAGSESSLVARSKKKHHPSGWCFLFGMPRAGWNSLPQPARSASNPEVKAGLLRMALPFVGCREASSSLVYFAAQSAKNKEKPSFGRFQSVKKACHCEPVRAAKQVPLGYRLAWQSVSKMHDSCVFMRICG